MTQDTRKDPRAKVLTMTVRYKSATLDEFIEHHSHDVSRGGMFIKTPSPFPAGTLLKFEVKIAAEQRVMQGVGRVVWKREASDANEARPAGMGVKFIKIDDDSRKVIDQLIDARGDSQSNFEDGAAAEPAAARGSSPPQKETPAPTPLMPSAVAAPRSSGQRKATMIGLGAMGSTPSPAPVASPPRAESAEAFFPKTELDMPAPEDRTVMKQAAELLQEALREAGGSLEEIGTPMAPAAGRASESKRPATVEAGKKSLPAEPAPKLAPKPAPEPAPARVDSARAAAANLAATAPATRSAVAVNVPKARVALAETSPALTEGGGGKFVLAFAAVAVVGGIIYFASQKEAPPPAEPPAMEQPAPPPEPAPPPAPEPAVVAPPPAPAPEPSAAPSASAAPEAAASAAPSAAPSAKALVPPPVVAAPKPQAAPRPVVRQPARPKPVQPSEEGPSEAPTPPAASEPSAPAEKPPAAAKPAPAPKPTPAPKPAPAKKPPAGGDNPY